MSHMNTAYEIMTQLRKMQKKEKELKRAEDIAEIHKKMADLLADIRKFPNLSLSHHLFFRVANVEERASWS